MIRDMHTDGPEDIFVDDYEYESDIEYVRVECLQCGQGEYLNPRDVKSVHFCSRKCQNDYHREIDPGQWEEDRG